MRKILLQTSFIAFLAFIVWITVSFLPFSTVNVNGVQQIGDYESLADNNRASISSIEPQYQMGVPTITLNTLKAFPTAYGGGSNTTGGRGGTVIHVTNLNDSGPGSLREALLTETTRIIVFDVSGRIHLTSLVQMNLASSNVTIAGETAPRGGITISGFPILMGTGYYGGVPNEGCNNVIWRYIRFENKTTTGVPDVGVHSGLISSGTDGLMLDHCTIAMNDDQGLSFNANYSSLANHTIQRCIFSENATNLVWGINPPTGTTGNFSYLYNLHSHQGWRNPNAGYEGRYDVINNVYFNWSIRNININGRSPDMNHYNNYYKPGSYTSSVNKLQTGNTTTDPTIYTANNYHPILYPTPQLDDRNLWSDFSTGNPVAGQYFVTTIHSPLINPAPLLTAQEAYDNVIADVGANAYVSDSGTRGTYLDSYDTQRINDVVTSTSRDPLNKIWSWPILPNNTRPGSFYNNSKSNNIPEFFWDAHGLTSDSGIKAIYDFGTYQVVNNAGYNNLEIYLAWAAGDFDRLEKTTTGNDQLIINGIPETISAYAPVAQDNGTFEILDNDHTLKLSGNAWKKADLNYTITANTVLEFDLKVTGLGEIQGIAFDNDNALGGETLFQFAGTQTDYGLQDYNTYSGNDWVHFAVPIGEHITGDYNYIVFAADKDSSPGSQESSFRNIVLNEGTTGLTINGAVQAIDAYAPGSQDNGSFEIQDGGNTLRLTGNAWKKALFDYTVTPNTIMEFDLKVLGTGEIHGIAFDNDNTLGGEVLFQFTGTQSDYGLQDYATYSGNDWVHFAIPVGEHFTGTYNNIVFVADDDSSPSAQESFFRNIVFNEGVTGLNINGVQEMVDAYDPVGQDAGSFEIQDGGNTIRLTGNAWKKAPFNYTVTSNTVLEFDLMVTGTGEIHGIAFDNNDTLGGELLFQFAGTQSNYGLQDYNTYSGNGWVHFAIPLGGHFTGTYNNIVFVADDDSPSSAQESFFRNIVLNENSPSNLSARIFGSEEGGEPYSILFPNKAKTFAKLVSSGEIKDVALYTINGSLVKKVASKATTNLEIALHDIPDGLYIVRYRTNDSIQSKKLVVEH